LRVWVLPTRDKDFHKLTGETRSRTNTICDIRG
jgi:hypothetical protein